MHVFGIALITLLSFVGLGALITGFVAQRFEMQSAPN